MNPVLICKVRPSFSFELKQVYQIVFFIERNLKKMRSLNILCVR